MSHVAYPFELAVEGEAGADADPVPYAVSFLRAHPLPRPPRRRRGRRLLMLASAATLAAACCGLRFPHGGAPEVAVAVTASVQRVALAAPGTASASHGWLLDPRPVLGADAYGMGESAPLGPALRPTTMQAEALPQDLAGQALAEQSLAETDRALIPKAQTPRPAAVQTLAQLLPQRVPLPVPRPAALRQPPIQTAMQTPRLAERRVQQSTRSVFQAARREEPSFFESIFGGGPAEGGAERRALAYAGTEGDGIALTPRRRLSPVPNPSEGVAVYDITAGSVTLPSGERLEAHSGLGEAMDNPRYVHMRMRGATPPGTYELTEREALFHGVRALRLNPVGGPGAIYGRVGLLTHTYMLGPKGASNGCISFRDYNRFLQAYLRGEIRRVVVVAGNGDAPPAIGNNRIGQDRLGMGARARGSNDG